MGFKRTLSRYVVQIRRVQARVRAYLAISAARVRAMERIWAEVRETIDRSIDRSGASCEEQSMMMAMMRSGAESF
jgi:hypothetical protein